MSSRVQAPTPIETLERFWRRHPFHDESIEEIVPVNRRVVVRLRHYTLVITEVSKFTKQIELPTNWLYDSLAQRGDSIVLKVEADCGEFEIVGRNIRLIRNRDMAILIPAIDA